MPVEVPYKKAVAQASSVYNAQGNIVQSIDITNGKCYNYEYEEGRIIRAAESDITLSGEVVTAKALVNTIRYAYDTEGQLTKKVITPASGSAQTVYYETGDGNTVVKFSAGGRTVTSHSKTDSFGRKTFDELQLGTDFVSRQFVYHAGKVTQEHKDKEKVKSSATTQLVSQIILSDGRTLSYAYDAEERITKVTDSVGGVTEYTYDALGQLLTETVNGQVVNSMEYDNYGNIVKKNGKVYTYADAAWKDLLTSYNGQAITYDAQGNPTTYLGHTLTWEKGRQLKSFDGNTYTYNANGIRTSKTVNGIKHTYTLDGTKILREAWGSNTIVPMYDNEDSVCGIQYNDVPYYFIKNLQGDVIAIVNKDAQTVAKYAYDAWGVCTIAQDTTDCNIASMNPYRYRGYYFDAEIGLYYLQSRYYDPEIGRFINVDSADCFATGEKPILYNLFTYCENNPVNLQDVFGGLSWSIFPKIIKYLSEAASKLGEWLLNKYGLSPRKYAHKLKYNNASTLTKFVNDNKKKFKKAVRGFAAIAACLEVLILASECFNKIKNYSKREILKVVASLAFTCITAILGEIVSQVVSWIIATLTGVLAWAKQLIKLIVDLLFEYILGMPWVSNLETKFIQYVNEANIGSYFTALLQASKAVFV